MLTIGLFYTVTTWLMVNAQGGQGLQEYIGGLKADPTAFLFVLSDTYIGSNLTTVMTLLFATSVFAALLAFHNAVARYFFALGREGLLPTPLARPTRSTPHCGSLSQSALAFVVAARRHDQTRCSRCSRITQPDARHPRARRSLAVIAFPPRHPELDTNVLRTNRPSSAAFPSPRSPSMPPRSSGSSSAIPRAP